ncbi:DUF6562 domain-containing protein [Phocaeicola plebeius]|uniref:DUF6562 domain-containing protein n=1 Tax=Phocaeicola plebeius TaxID=310297 RepID=UPI0026F3461B|nr:DUF6562 domain-containing protein [Phocaeicola plebeius]
MNKKLFLGMFAAAGMLFATSCSNDELDVVQSGNEAQVTFSLAAEGGIATRAISDGTGAKKLVYAVYNANGELIRTIANADVNGQIVDNSAFDDGRTENVTITLAKGQQYTVAFWAQNPNCTAYTTTDLKNVTVDYAGSNNDETRDAFFKAETFTVTGNADIDVVLKRPFAQINVGVTEADWNTAVASDIEIEKSKVTIKNAATSINLLTGQVEGEQTVEYGFDIIPAKFTTPETLSVDLDKDGTKEDYVYLSMSYILANDATTGYAKTTLEDLDFTFAPKSGNNINFSEGLNAVPVQRNWRTNIIGKILTGDVTFNITIDPIYDGEYNNGDAYGVKANNTYYKTIEDAIDAGATEIELAAGLWKMPSVGNKNLKISGANKDAKIDLSDGVALHNTSVDFTNVTIVKESEDYVGFYHTNVLKYTDCVFENEYWAYGIEETFTNCVFNQTSNARYNVWTYGAKTATFTNCMFNSAGKSALVYGETLSEWHTANFKNCVFNATEPVEDKAAIEIDSRKTSYNVNIENCTASGFDAGSVSGNILYNLKNGELGTNCNITITGINTYAEGLVKDANGNYFASSNEGITNAISAGATTINLTQGNYVIPSSAQRKTLTFIGTGTPEDVEVAVTKVGTGYENCDYGLDGSTVTFEGITITTNSSTYIGYARCKGTYKNCVINGTYTLYGDSKFERCTFNVSGDVYNIWTWGAKNIEFDRCTFSSDGKALLLYQEGSNTVNLTVKSCIFDDKGGLTSKKAAIEIGDAPYGATPTYNVTVSGTTVNGYEINDKGYNTGTTLWGNKDSMLANRLNVRVNGVDVY